MLEVTLSPSKSMVNRLLVLKSWAPGLTKNISSKAQDVTDLLKCLDAIEQKKFSYFIQSGGTTLRFLLARLSREEGKFQIEASQRLLSRPHDSLFQTLSHLGVKIHRTPQQIYIESAGWCDPRKTLDVDCSQSTQFATALLLNTVNLPFHLTLRLLNLESSRPYLDMTLQMMKTSGLKLEAHGTEIHIPAGQKILRLPDLEIDLSSAFSLASTSLLKQGVRIKDFPEVSLQADFVFLEVLQAMGIHWQRQYKNILIPAQMPPYQGIEWNLSKSPDLLPVLSALCALSPETSKLSGLENLKYKESDRVMKSVELLQKAGAHVQLQNHVLEIHGPIDLAKVFTFDPDQDHRMAMAAAVLKAAGQSIQIENPEVVEKSFPEFWHLSGLSPQ
jgi:3-phosphoshikimate 1-carboxyvinyltransferase